MGGGYGMGSGMRSTPGGMGPSSGGPSSGENMRSTPDMGSGYGLGKKDGIYDLVMDGDMVEAMMNGGMGYGGYGMGSGMGGGYGMGSGMRSTPGGMGPSSGGP